MVLDEDSDVVQHSVCWSSAKLIILCFAISYHLEKKRRLQHVKCAAVKYQQDLVRQLALMPSDAKHCVCNKTRQVGCAELD